MKYKVPVVITLSMEVHASDEAHALEIAKAEFDIEMFLDKLEDATKFQKPKQEDSDDEEEIELGEPYDSDDEDDDE